ncbi:MAG: DUF1489 family protein [Hyphomicrobiales bacterium]|nr:DUF1489 family protein [Hyphomicrobiales bacterium]
MPLHLLKLCVGATSIDDLASWVAARRARAEALGETFEQKHTTRMLPKRAAELLAGGSLYWVIKGHIAARQALLDIRPFTGDDGISRCDLVLDQTIVAVAGRDCRPFQGWRYLAAADAPGDIEHLTGGAAALPEDMRRELRSLGLL